MYKHALYFKRHGDVPESPESKGQYRGHPRTPELIVRISSYLKPLKRRIADVLPIIDEPKNGPHRDLFAYLTDKLNRDDFRDPYGRPWTHTSVKKFLQKAYFPR